MRSVLREVVVPTMPRPICLLRLHDDILGLLPFPAMCRSSAARGKSVPVGEPLRRGRFTPAPAFAPCGCRGGSITVFAGRRDAGVVERGGLENRCGGDPTQGSNPCLSATCPRESDLPIRPRPDFSVVFEGYAEGAVHRQQRGKAEIGLSRAIFSGAHDCADLVNFSQAFETNEISGREA